jgi:hypothetical protein
MDIPRSELFRFQDDIEEIHNEKQADDEADNVRHGFSLSQPRA